MPPGRVFQAGFTSSRLWLRATGVNTLPQRTRFVWSLYAFVDSAALFVQPGGRGAAHFVAGTSGRAVASCLPFWLEAHAQDVVCLAVENHTGATYLPTYLTTTEGFLAYEQAFFFTKRWSWLLGLYLGSALLKLVLFAFLRDLLPLWYGAYILFGAWFLLMEDGLDAWLLPQPMYSLLLLALACQLNVLCHFMRLRQGWPRLHRLSRGLSGLAVAAALAYGLLAGPAGRAGAGALNALNGSREDVLWVVLVGGSLLLVTVGVRGRRPQRRLAGYYGLAYACFFGGSLHFLLNRTGLVNIHLLNPNSLAWGLALELVLLSVPACPLSCASR